MSDKRTTVGAIAVELQKQEAPSRDPIELEREIHKEYLQNVIDCIERSKKDFAGDFYVVVITKKEKLLPNVLRHYFFGRLSCPTPDYDQAVYHFDRKKDDIEFLWALPSRDTCELLYNNAVSVDKSEHELLKFVLDFYDETLLRKAKRLNKERKDSPLKE